VATVKARVQLDPAHVLAVGNSLAAPYVAETTRRALNRARVGSPVRDGVLRASHSMTMRVQRTYVAGRVEVGASYATMVHDGTRPHIIRPRTKKVLRFYWKRKGKIVYSRQVRHPGTRPRPWLYRALLETAGPRGFRVSRTYVARRVG
jgi:hypothetical protein